MTDDEIMAAFGAANTPTTITTAHAEWHKAILLRFARSLLATAQADRNMLESVSQDLEISTWQCPRCGHAEDCKDMDAASMLRDYLAAAPSAALSFDAAWDSIDWDKWRMEPIRELVRHLHTLTAPSAAPGDAQTAHQHDWKPADDLGKGVVMCECGFAKWPEGGERRQ